MNSLHILIALALCLASNLTLAQTIVSHRSPETPGDQREDFNDRLIVLALEKTRAEFGPFSLYAIPPMNTPRSIYVVRNNSFPNLLVEMSYNPELTQDQQLTYIPISVDMGVIGYRVCFVNPSKQEALRQVKTLDDLKQFTIGQGVGWIDNSILRHNGLQVVESSNFLSLYRMVAGGRIDLFCRGINEIAAEFDLHKDIPNLKLDDAILLSYKMPRFFYLNSHNTQVKRRMQKGLETAYHDGSMIELWKEFYLDNIQALNLNNRVLLELENPLLDGLNKDYEAMLLNPLQLNQLSEAN